MEKNNGLMVLVVALVVVVLGLGGFIVYDKVLREDKVKENTPIVDDKDEEMSQEEINNLGKKLFKKTSFIGSYGDELFFYDKNKLDYSSIDNKNKLALAMTNAANGLFTEEVNYSFSDGTIYEDLGYIKSISKEDFEESYKELFGNDKNVVYEEFYYSDYICTLVEESVECKNSGGRGSAGIYYLKYDQTEYVNNNIIVYTSLLGYNNWSAGDKGAIYNDYDLINQIDDRYIEGNVKETLFKDYGDKASKYKLTFEKDTNDNWYWVSTELVK